MEFASPWALAGLALVAFLAWRLLSRPGAGGGAVRFSALKPAAAARVTLRTTAAGLVPWLRLAALTLLVLALARPQTEGATQREVAEGIDIMLTFDISGSMQAEDFPPTNRFIVARDILQQFTLEAQNDRLGLVIFAGKAFTQCPLTLDREMVARLIAQVEMGVIEDGTAIGMAIATAAHRLRQSDAESRVIILMTDGVNNAGRIDPITAARAAAALGIRVYAVGVGREGGAPIPIGEGFLGKQYLRNPDGSLYLADLEEDTLREIARITGGKYFRATDPEAMERIYTDIRRMEKSRFEGAVHRAVEEEAGRYLWPGLMLLLLAVVLDNTLGRRTP